MDDEDSIIQLLSEIVGGVAPLPGLFYVCVGRAHNTGTFRPVPLKKRLTGVSMILYGSQTDESSLLSSYWKLDHHNSSCDKWSFNDNVRF